MARKIKVESIECGSVKMMYVDHPVFKEKQKTMFEIQNKVDSEEDIIVEFFYMTDKGGVPVPGFCTEMDSAETEFRIAENAKESCTPADGINPNFYAYTVKNDDFPTLDPVIIIEPQFGFSSALSFGVTALIAAAAGGAAFGWLGTRAFSKKA